MKQGDGESGTGSVVLWFVGNEMILPTTSPAAVFIHLSSCGCISSYGRSVHTHDPEMAPSEKAWMPQGCTTVQSATNNKLKLRDIWTFTRSHVASEADWLYGQHLKQCLVDISLVESSAYE